MRRNVKVMYVTQWQSIGTVRRLKALVSLLAAHGFI